MLQINSVCAMDIKVEGDIVTMTGAVAGHECTELEKIIAKTKIAKIILRDSLGGDAGAGYCVGSLIRKNAIATSIKGRCESSCSRMWLGGVTRAFVDNDSWVGLHGNYATSGPIKGDLGADAPDRLRNWLPVMAPNIDEALMEQWIHLPKNTQMMRFYSTKAAICDGSICRPIPERTADNAGLLTSESTQKDIEPDRYPRVGPIADLVERNKASADRVQILNAYAKFDGPKALATSADGRRLTWRSDKDGLAPSITRTIEDCQKAQIAASQQSIKCHIIALENTLTASTDAIEARKFPSYRQ